MGHCSIDHTDPVGVLTTHCVCKWNNNKDCWKKTFTFYTPPPPPPSVCQNQQARICLLYLPLLELLYQNLKQLSAQHHTSSPGLGFTGSRDDLRSTGLMDSRRTSTAIDKDHGPVAQNGHLVRREDSRGSLFMDPSTPDSSELHRRGSEVRDRQREHDIIYVLFPVRY
ncbi:unnamed protein product [Oncorhynchus mykiss]|uniref:Uncharacterized protein n=1 Tax=Oncorhynchus mykiss TaxID=8022 RepID=A0A060XVR3_ONCMY|nr:unnamed protein product [Oncorhynchus mykiss]